MVVLGGEVVSYERGTPVWHTEGSGEDFPHGQGEGGGEAADDCCGTAPRNNLVSRQLLVDRRTILRFYVVKTGLEFGAPPLRTKGGGGDFAHGQGEEWREAEGDRRGAAPLDGHLGLATSAQRLCLLNCVISFIFTGFISWDPITTVIRLFSFAPITYQPGLWALFEQWLQEHRWSKGDCD